MALKIKDAINKTEQIKNNTSKIKENINNKLVEIGGNRANNLASVPDEITNLTNNFENYAVIEINESHNMPKTDILTYPFNVGFKPKVGILNISFTQNGVFEESAIFMRENEYGFIGSYRDFFTNSGQNARLGYSLDEKRLELDSSMYYKDTLVITLKELILLGGR